MWPEGLGGRSVHKEDHLSFSSAFHYSLELLAKLSCYGISDQLLTRIRSFLTDRKQYVTVSSCSSPACDVISGVPQGSVLGQVLFIIYVNVNAYVCMSGRILQRCFALYDILLWPRWSHWEVVWNHTEIFTCLFRQSYSRECSQISESPSNVRQVWRRSTERPRRSGGEKKKRDLNDRSVKERPARLQLQSGYSLIMSISLVRQSANTRTHDVTDVITIQKH